MSKFKDDNQKEWDLIITIAGVKRVKEHLNVDLLEIENKDTLTKLGTDLCFVVDVIYCILMPKLKEAKITDEMFGESMGGEAMQGAFNALYASLIDFSQALNRPDRAKVLTAQKRVVDTGVKKALLVIDALDAKATAMIDAIDVDAQVQKAYGKKSTKVRAQ